MLRPFCVPHLPGRAASPLYHLPQFLVFGVPVERRYRVTAVMSGEVWMIVHGEVHAHGRGNGRAEAAEDEVFHPEELRRMRRVGASGAGPEVEVGPISASSAKVSRTCGRDRPPEIRVPCTSKVTFTYTALVANVRLLPVDSDLAETLRMGSENFRRRYGATVAAENAPILRGVVEQTLGMLPGVRREADRWGGYLAVDETSDLIVGTCAFKGPPTADGTVEIAYYTFGPYEGQGYAKGMARALISIAHSSPLVRHVIAHTLPERNPSTSVLRSVGMRFAGDVRDPVDGPVWRWRLESGNQGASHSPVTS